jgi:hypothetical protein
MAGPKAMGLSLVIFLRAIIDNPHTDPTKQLRKMVKIIPIGPRKMPIIP